MSDKLIKIKSDVAITVFKQNVVEKKQVIKGSNGIGEITIKKVVPQWQKGRCDIKKGSQEVPEWALATAMGKTLLDQEKIVIIDSKAAKAIEKKALAEKKAKELAAKETAKKEEPKVELPD